MKPKDLKVPFSFAQRRVMRFEGWMAIPGYFHGHGGECALDWKAVFVQDQKVYVEFCSGNGRWIAQMAKKHPESNFVAVEKRFDRVRKIWAKQQNEGLDNLFIVWGVAEDFTRHYVHEGSVAGVFVNFPDPWPKDKHAKHRLIHADFVGDAARILGEGGNMTLVTDDLPYCQQMIEVMQGSSLSSLHPQPYFVTELSGYGSSWFEDLWREKGRTIHYLQYEKVPCPVL